MRKPRFRLKFTARAGVIRTNKNNKRRNRFCVLFLRITSLLLHEKKAMGRQPCLRVNTTSFSQRNETTASRNAYPIDLFIRCMKGERGDEWFIFCVILICLLCFHKFLIKGKQGKVIIKFSPDFWSIPPQLPPKTWLIKTICFAIKKH